jgi:competence protein ComEA
MLEFTKNQKLALVAIVGLIAIGISVKLMRNASSPVYGGVVLKEAGQSADGVNVVTSDSDSTRAGGLDGGKVIFQVAGCVNSPNVFSLPKGSRIVDAIKAAGGLRPGADIQSLNLASKIEDGSRIFIPSTQSSTASATSVVPPQTAAATASTAMPVASGSKSKSTKASGGTKLHAPGDGVVHINTADANELQRLPGVGPSTAQAILDYRTQIGKFSSPEQLDDVKGIGPKKLEKMRPFVAL